MSWMAPRRSRCRGVMAPKRTSRGSLPECSPNIPARPDRQPPLYLSCALGAKERIQAKRPLKKLSP